MIIKEMTHMYYKKTKPMSTKRINMILKNINSEYRLAKLETGEMVLEKQEEGGKQNE